jgi:hypothetical protein
MHHIKLLVNEDEIDFLLARGYPLKRTDNRSIAEAVSAYLSDSVLEGRMSDQTRHPGTGGSGRTQSVPPAAV